jgi:uncharacterized protein (DUF58 family)
MRRPTKRALIIALIGVILVLAGATAQAGWLFVLAAGVLGTVLGSFVVHHRLGALEVERTVPRRARVDDDVRVGLTVRNGAKVRSPLLFIEDTFGAFEPVRVGVEPIDPGGVGEIELVRKAAQRGVFDAARVTMTSGAPFGLTRSRRRTEVASPLTVVPRWADLRSFPILEPSSSPSDVLHERARTGAGLEYLGVRDYRPGDPLRSVHWRSSARADRLIVREFELEIASRVGIVFAGRDHGEGSASAYETLISAVASIGIYALSTGHPIHLARHGAEGIDYLGEPGKFDLLDWLASATPADEPLLPLVDHMVAQVGRRGTIVLCAVSSGASGASLSAAVRRAQSAGARAIVVIARASTWGPGLEDGISGSGLGGGRAAIRELEAGKELASCLAE